VGRQRDAGTHSQRAQVSNCRKRSTHLNSIEAVPIGPLQLRRFDEAIAAGKKALRLNPSHPGAYRNLASAFAHLGRDAEAREAAARLLEVDPAVTISAWIARADEQM
jgi:tetratricopeptide (TPR) repeat protein